MNKLVALVLVAFLTACGPTESHHQYIGNYIGTPMETPGIVRVRDGGNTCYFYYDEMSCVGGD